MRLDHHPDLGPLDRRPVSFVFEGRSLPGYAGESIASALYANGVRLFSRSFKYRRPRGLHCGAGSCPNCAMRVDGLPGVTTCCTALRGGEVVERERGWPSADRDLLAALDRLGSLAPIGFQYRRFRRSPWLAAKFEWALARLAARGSLPDERAARAVASGGGRVIETEVAVIGGGAAGMSAAVSASDSASSVVLVEHRASLGGRLAFDPVARGTMRELVAAVEARPQVRLLAGAAAFAWYEPEALLIGVPDGFVELRARRWVVCTGTHPQPLAFAGNDLPGVMLARCVRRLLHADRVLPGGAAVVVTDGDDGLRLAEELRRAGVAVPAVADSRAEAAPQQANGTRLLPGHTIRSAHGRRHVRAAALAPVGRNGSPVRVASDLVCVAVSERPANELVLQRLLEGSSALELPLDLAAPREAADPLTGGLWLAGSVAGAPSVEAAAEQGRAAGAAAARTERTPA